MKLIMKHSRKLGLHLLNYNQKTNLEKSKKKVIPKIDNFELINSKGTSGNHIFKILDEWIKTLFTKNFSGLYCLRILDYIITNDILSIVYVIASVLLMLEKK